MTIARRRRVMVIVRRFNPSHHGDAKTMARRAAVRGKLVGEH